MNNPKIIDTLNLASSIELYQLYTLVGRMIEDPQRIAQIRLSLHLGQTVRFWYGRAQRMATGKIVAMSPSQATIHGIEDRYAWKLPYAAIEPPAPGEDVLSRHQQERAATPTRPRKEDFKHGDKITFEDRYAQTQVGVITRINQKTATIDTGNGSSWRVGFGLLRPMLDI